MRPSANDARLAKQGSLPAILREGCRHLTDHKPTLAAVIAADASAATARALKAQGLALIASQDYDADMLPEGVATLFDVATSAAVKLKWQIQGQTPTGRLFVRWCWTETRYDVTGDRASAQLESANIGLALASAAAQLVFLSVASTTPAVMRAAQREWVSAG